MKQVIPDPPHDEHGNEATGVYMNCGAAMVENPQWPWCINCEVIDDDGRPMTEAGTTIPRHAY